MVNSTLEAPISPELCLVDPDLAARARLLLPPATFFRASGFEPSRSAIIADGGSVGHGLIRLQPRTELRRRAVPVATLCALVGVGLVLGVADMLKTPSASVSQSVPTRSSAPPAATAERPLVGSASRGRQRAAAVPASPHANPGPTPVQSQHRVQVPATTLPLEPATASAGDARVKSAGAAAEAGRTAVAPPDVAPLILRWAAVPGATMYDVILWQGSTRVLDLWPSTTHVTVPAVWTYKGKVYHRSAGAHYLWFVYAALGSKTALRYSPLIRSGAF